MPGQWEFQIGSADALTVSDHMYVARWPLPRLAENYAVISRFAATRIRGDRQGDCSPTNF